MSDRFKVSNLLAQRLGEHQVSLPALLQRAGLPPGFFQRMHTTRDEAAVEFFYLQAEEVQPDVLVDLCLSWILAIGRRGTDGHLWEGTSPGEWRTRHNTAGMEVLRR